VVDPFPIDVARDRASFGRLLYGNLLAVGPVIPGRLKGGLPNNAARRPGGPLVRNEPVGEGAVGHCQALGDKPAREILAGHLAGGDPAVVLVESRGPRTEPRDRRSAASGHRPRTHRNAATPTGRRRTAAPSRVRRHPRPAPPWCRSRTCRRRSPGRARSASRAQPQRELGRS
jgi:hypothetical protein